MLELAYSVLTILISMAEVQGLAVLSEISRVPHLPPSPPLPSPPLLPVSLQLEANMRILIK